MMGIRELAASSSHYTGNRQAPFKTALTPEGRESSAFLHAPCRTIVLQSAKGWGFESLQRPFSLHRKSLGPPQKGPRPHPRGQ